ncbi:MAG TPA: hypothetical protein PKH23_07270, partial [Bacillota bacterium]|nr:hypothetical protein [Bacillota bacterium]
MNQQRKFGGFSFYIILMVVILAVTMFLSRSEQKDVTLFEVEQMIQSGLVESVTIDGASLSLKMSQKAVETGSQATLKKTIPS